MEEFDAYPPEPLPKPITDTLAFAPNFFESSFCYFDISMPLITKSFATTTA